MKKRKLLIVVDMQNDFVYGSLKNMEAIKIIPNVKQKIETYKNDKNADNVVLFTLDTHYDDYLDTLEGKKLPVKHCIAGTDGQAIIPELKQFVGKYDSFEKNTFGYLNWHELDIDLMYDSVELCGVCTDICVVSNALILRALYPNMQIIVDSKCCAGVTLEKHEAALETMRSCQIDVI